MGKEIGTPLEADKEFGPSMLLPSGRPHHCSQLFKLVAFKTHGSELDGHPLTSICLPAGQWH
eukprot:scaffold99995_cov36-Tisochrysis_lutea.AAC.2